MTPISDVRAGAVRPWTTAGKALDASRVQEPGEEAQSRRRKPVMDEYVPSEPREPSGRYWMGRDGDGQPRIYFDSRPPEADAPEQPEGVPGAEEQDQAGRGAKDPEGKKDEVWKCSTGKADREIEELKRKRQELEQRLGTETDEARIQELERQLARVERELRRKDRDTYRRQNAAFTRLA